MLDNTIAAVSTPYGKGGIAVIRISGSEAIDVANKVFSLKNKRKLYDVKPNSIVHGDIIYESHIIDDGIAAIFKAPHSYTGEDTVEISCHGGILITQLVLEAVYQAGAIPAQAGEFTRRAFISGKLSLSQAEAVIELIEAKSIEKIKMSAAQAKGALSRRIDAIYESLKTIVSSVYAYIDFPDEDLTDISVNDMKNMLYTNQNEVDNLIKTYHTGKAISEGIKTVIVGKPNTGKSSLLNLILGQDRAIVTDVAGTTRDILEENAIIGKVMLRLYDTAGIREAFDIVEKIGVERAISKISEAELILAVFDNSEKLNDDDMSLINKIRTENCDCTCIAIINKTDLEPRLEKDKLLDHFEFIIELSTKNGDGFENLKLFIENLFVDGNINYNETGIVANARQYVDLCKTKECIDNAINALEMNLTQDVAGLDIELALSYLAELDGRQITNEIVDEIFHKFCVGK